MEWIKCVITDSQCSYLLVSLVFMSKQKDLRATKVTDIMTVCTISTLRDSPVLVPRLKPNNNQCTRCNALDLATPLVVGDSVCDNNSQQ